MAEEYDPEEGYDPGSEPLPGSAPVSDAQILQEIAAADRLTQSQQPGQPGQAGGGPEGNYGSPVAPPPPQQVALPLVNPAASYRLLGQSQPASFTGAQAPPQKRERTYQPAKPDYDLVGESQAAGGAFAPPPPPEPGLATKAMDIFSRGLLRANEDVKQSTQVTTGNKPVASQTPQEYYEQPPTLSDFGSPSVLAAKAWYGLARSYPTVAATIAGSVAGGVIGGAVGTAGGAAAGGVPAVVTGPGGAAIGAGIGGVAGAGLAGAWQALGPAYLSELQKLPPNPTAKQTDEAWDAAMAEVVKSGVVSAASMALFTAGKPVGNFLKGFFTKAATTTAPAVAPVAGLPLRVGVQAVGQPAISVGGQAGYNVATGKPAGEGLSEAAAGGLLNVLPDAAGRIGARALGYGRPRPGDLVNPTTTGLPADVEAALGPRGTQGALPLGETGQLNLQGGADTRPRFESPVTGGRGLGVGEAERAAGGVGPSRPGELVGPGNLANQRALDLTGGQGPPQNDLFNRQTPQGPTPPPPRPTFPEGPVVQPPVPGIGDTNVAAAAPIQQGAADILRRTGVRNIPGETLFAGYEGGGTPPTGPMAVRDPIGRLGPAEPYPGGGRGVGVGEDLVARGIATPIRPGELAGPGDLTNQGALGLPPPGPARPVGPTKYGTPTPAAVSPRPKWSDFSVEKDHLDASRWVAKNATGDVTGKGVSQQAARADAVARRGKVYPPEPGETAAAKAGEAAGRPPIVIEGTEGLGAAKATMDAAAAAAEERHQEALAQQTPAEKAGIKLNAEQQETGMIGETTKTKKELNAERLARGRETAKANREAKAAEKAKAAGTTASVPFMITQGMRRQLADLGYTAEQVREMTPVRANEIIAAGEKAEAGTGPVKPAAAEAAAPDEQASSRAGETVTEPVAESVRKKAPDETVTETRGAGAEKAPESAKSEVTTGSKEELDAAVERAQAAYDEANNEYHNHRITKAELTDAERTLNAAKKAAERTKSGAFSMGEGEEVVPLTDAERQRQSSGMAQGAGAAIRGELARQTRDLQPRPVPWQPTEGASKIREGMEIITALLKGDINLTEAIGRYGVKLPGTQGRPRKFASLAEVAREALRASDPGIADTIRRNMENMRKVGRVTSEDYKNLKAQLDLLEAAHQKKAALEAFIEELQARDRGAAPVTESILRGRVNDRQAQADRVTIAYRSTQIAVNGPLLRKLRFSSRHTLHDLLDTIIDSPGAKALAPQLHELAKVFRRILPDMEVITDRNLKSERTGDSILGQYDPVKDTITINPSHFEKIPSYHSPVVVLLHEAAHAATNRYTEFLYRTPEADLKPTQLAHKRALEAIAREVREIADSETKFKSYETDELKYTAFEYNSGAPHEIISQIFTQPEVTAILAQTDASPTLRNALVNAGFGRGIKSVWDGFKKVMRSAFGLGPGINDSVLDHVFQPLTEIVESGVRYRKEVEAARNGSIVASEHALGPVEKRDDWSRRALQVATSAADKGNVGWRAALRGAMQGGTLHAIHDFIKPYAPSVTGHRDALERVTHASEAERVRQVITHDARGGPVAEANIDKAMRLRREMTEGPDVPQVNKLATDVTLAGMSVIDPRRNAHLVTQAELNQQQAFQRIFDALDPRAQQTYRELNEYHNEIYRAEREAQVKNYVELAFPNLTNAEHDLIREQMRTRQGIEDVIARPDATPVALMMGKRWADAQDLVRLIAKSQQAGFVDGDFFPARRHGEYIVSAGQHDKPGYIVQMFETASEARKFREELRSKRKDVSQVFVKSDTTPRDLVGQAALSTLDRAMERAGLSDVAQEALRDTFVGQMIQQGTRAATRTMRREGILGASVDQGRNVLSDFLAYTTRIGHLTHGAEAIRTLYDVEKEVRALHQAGGGTETQVAIAQAGARELRRRMLPADGDTSADLSGRGVRGLSTLTVLNTLLRPAHYFMQLAGNHTAAASLLAARHGIGGVGALNRALAQLSGVASGAAMRGGMAALRRDLNASHWDLADLYRSRLKRGGDIDPAHVDLLIDRMNQASLINHTWIREIQRLAGPQGFGDHRFNFVSRFLDAAGAGEHALDSMMRVGTAKAGFVSEFRKNGGNLQGALDYAMQMARDSQPDYSRHNKSRLATAQGSLKWIAPLVTQFKQFGFHMYGVQGNLLATAIRGATGQEKREAIKALAYLQASHALLWGGVAGSVFGSLPAMVGFGLYDLISGEQRPHTNQELETQSRNWVKDITGSKTAADIFAHGVPMAFGADVHRSLQFTNLLGVPELKSYDKAGGLNLLGQVMTGAAGDTVAGLLDSMSKVLRGDVRMETIAKMMPRIIRDPMEAYVWGTEGLKTGRGQMIVPAKEFSYGDLALKAAGFIPAATSVPRDARAAESLAMQTEKDHKDVILDRFVQAKPADRSKVLAEIYRYNARVPPDERISSQSIKSRLTEQARINAQPGLYGMRVPRTDIKPALERTRFASP